MESVAPFVASYATGVVLASVASAALTVLFDKLLPWYLKSLLVFLVVGHWFNNISHLITIVRLHVLQFVILCALFELFRYTIFAQHGVSTCWGVCVLFGNVIRNFVAYLRVEGPINVESVQYMMSKLGFIVYGGTTLLLVDFYGLRRLVMRVIWISAGTTLCLLVALCMVWKWQLLRYFRLPDLVKTLFGKVTFVSIDVLWKIWSIYDTLEALALFWLPKAIYISCSFLERQWMIIQGNKSFDYSSCKLNESKNEIRLLRLKRRGIFSGMLKVEIFTASLNDPILYEALSYRWGTATEKRLILLNGKHFQCFPSAHDLLYARSSWFHDQVVWLDAICINQDDLEERAKQVNLMRRIYAGATRVIVWPGDMPKSRMASIMLYEVFQMMSAMGGTQLDLKKLFYMDRYSPKWLAFTELFRNLYFTRIWVLQAVAVASRVHVLHGGIYFDWEVMMRIMLELWLPQNRALLSYTNDPDRRVNYHSNMTASAENATIMWVLRHNHGNTPDSQRPPLGKLLPMCKMFNFTDPRDKIYALLGLATEISPPLVLVDYDIKPAKLYITSARKLMQCEENVFEILAHAGIGYRNNTDVLDELSDSLPSWTPNWSSHQLCTTLASRAPVGFSSATHVTACLDFGQPHDSRADTLSLRGIIIDAITELSDTLDDTDQSGTVAVFEHFSTLNGWLREVSEISSRNIDVIYAMTGQSRNEALWRTIIGDTIGTDNPAPSEFEHHYRTWIDFLGILESTGDRTAAENVFQGANRQGQDLRAALMDASSMTGTLQFSTSFAEISVGRRYYVTREQCMGLAPRGAVQGDFVCVFAGAPTPHLIRRSQSATHPETFQLVGECYLHGFMDPLELYEHDMKMITLV